MIVDESPSQTIYLSFGNLRKVLEERGGRFVDGVSKNTDVFIHGEDRGDTWSGSKKQENLDDLNEKGRGVRELTFKYTFI